MSTFKKAKVVMLPTNQKAKERMIYLKPKIGIFNKTASENHNNNVYDCNPQHLYIISDDEIKEGDWKYDTKLNIIIQHGSYVDGCKKIIATTDNSLQWLDESERNYELARPNGLWKCLPQPSQQFIQKFIEEYNKGNVITDVLVEYENKFDGKEYVDELDAYGYDIIKSILKINPKDNTITIKKVKDSWNREEVDRMLDEQASITTAEMLEKFKDYRSREEVEKLIRKAIVSVSPNPAKGFIDKWIEENL